ncbi:MAG TPA: DUF6544 family protein [Acidimicrobiia bacterium]
MGATHRCVQTPHRLGEGDQGVSTSRVTQLEARLAQPATPGAFSESELDGLPPAVRRYFSAAIAPGTPLALSARLRMRGTIKIGRWLPFRAREVLAPHQGFVWPARVAGVIGGADGYADGDGRMEWKLAGLVTLAHADGPDVSRSAAGRGGAEAVWVPTSLLPRYGVTWSASDETQIIAGFQVDDTPIEAHYQLDPDGRPRSIVFDRWGDPDNTGTWAWHRCGGEFSAYATFDGVTIPSEGRFGWALRNGPMGRR